jgi:hypothetical protein
MTKLRARIGDDPNFFAKNFAAEWEDRALQRRLSGEAVLPWSLDTLPLSSSLIPPSDSGCRVG